jgi:hypothetical protein
MPKKSKRKISGKSALKQRSAADKRHSKPLSGISHEHSPEPAVPIKKNIPKVAPGIPVVKKNSSDKPLSTGVVFPPPVKCTGDNIVAPKDFKVADAKPVASNFNLKKRLEQDVITEMPKDMSATLHGMNTNHSIIDLKNAFNNNVNVLKEVGALERDLKRLSDDFSDQIENLLEIANYLSNPDWTPKSIVDILHVLVRTLNMDVMTLCIPSINSSKISDSIYSRGYKEPPTSNIVQLWMNTFSKTTGLDWQKLMQLAQDSNTDLAYWIVQSKLNSVGYIPIRTHGIIYGFIFVGTYGKKSYSPIAAPLLDLCGSRIGIEYKMKFCKL